MLLRGRTWAWARLGFVRPGQARRPPQASRSEPPLQPPPSPPRWRCSSTRQVSRLASEFFDAKLACEANSNQVLAADPLVVPAMPAASLDGQNHLDIGQAAGRNRPSCERSAAQLTSTTN